MHDVRSISNVVELMDNYLCKEFLGDDKKLWENTYIKHQIDKRNRKEPFNLEDHIRGIVYSKSLPLDNITDDLRLQQSQIQLAEFCFNAYNEIEKSIIQELDRLEKLLTPREKSKSILGSFGRKLGDNLLQTAEYRQLKYAVDNYLPLDRELLEKEFSKIIEYHPSLYQEITDKHSVQEIRDKMMVYQKELSTRYTTICNVLGIPRTISGFQEGSGCDAKALHFYADEIRSTQHITCIYIDCRNIVKW